MVDVVGGDGDDVDDLVQHDRGGDDKGEEKSEERVGGWLLFSRWAVTTRGTGLSWLLLLLKTTQNAMLLIYKETPHLYSSFPFPSPSSGLINPRLTMTP